MKLRVSLMAQATMTALGGREEARELRQPWRDGTTDVVFDPVELSDPPAPRRADRDPGAASGPCAATRRGSAQPGWLGRRPSGAQPLFLTLLRDGPACRGAGGAP